MSRLGRSVLDVASWVVTRCLFRVDARDVEKIPLHGPFILISNHVTAFELPVLRVLLRPRVVRTLAKAASWDPWLLGWVLDQWQAIPIRRGEPDTAALRAALAVLKNGGILGIMPEGTRSGDGRLGAGNPGIVVLARKSGCPIVPMAFWGVERVKKNAKRLRRTDFHFRVGDPFTLAAPTGKLTHEDRRRLADDVMDHIARLMPDAYRGAYCSVESAPQSEV
jgi:1-acyl-sn-glycerol-3-phosphate acyltransferase